MSGDSLSVAMLTTILKSADLSLCLEFQDLLTTRIREIAPAPAPAPEPAPALEPAPAPELELEPAPELELEPAPDPFRQAYADYLVSPASRYLAFYDIHHQTYFHKGHGRVARRRETGEKISLDEAMEEAYSDSTIKGFSYNNEFKSVYFIKAKDWSGLKDKRVACKENPVPTGLNNQDSSDRWKWASLYLKK
jgi:hypothetical protein